MTAGDIGAYRAAIIRTFPELAGSTFRLITTGWDSDAVDVDDALIFKFPRHVSAERALVREAALLDAVRPALSMAVPALRIHAGPPLFSSHAKIKGDHLLAQTYDALPEEARRRLGDSLGRFYAELHGLGIDRMTRAGAGPIVAWQPLETIRAKALPALPPGLSARAERTLAAFERMTPDPLGLTYGFFDGHGWNMAFDPGSQRLNGIYDFADSGIGPLHQEFIYSTFISPDLTARIVTSYEALTGRALDRTRIAILTGVHRLSELAEYAHDPERVGMMVRSVEDWAAAEAEA